MQLTASECHIGEYPLLTVDGRMTLACADTVLFHGTVPRTVESRGNDVLAMHVHKSNIHALVPCTSSPNCNPIP